MSFEPKSPYAGLPTSPYPTRVQKLSPIDTSFRNDSACPSSTSEKVSPSVFIDTRIRRKDSLIFVNATIPLTPVTSSSFNEKDNSPFDGLVPRKRSAFARLFCCLGRQEKARRAAMRGLEYEKVGEKMHWSEY
jgi:hypothetical protein